MSSNGPSVRSRLRAWWSAPRCQYARCHRRLRRGSTVTVVPIFSAHDPRNFGDRGPKAPPIREDMFHPDCARMLGLVRDAAGGMVWLDRDLLASSPHRVGRAIRSSGQTQDGAA